MQATMSPSMLFVPALLVPAFLVASVLPGCSPRMGDGSGDMTTVLTDSDSDSDTEATTDDTAPTTLGTTTSTVTTEPPTTGEVSSTTVDTDTDTTGDTDGTTTEEAICDYDGVCDEDGGENVADCLHDCGTCEPDGVCDSAIENPFVCPSDCPATECELDGTVNALGEQCDDGNDSNEDACTETCNLNVCGDGYLFATENGGTEECDDGNLDDGDGCTSKCEREVRLVFLSSVDFKGDFAPKIGQFEGVEQADAQCQLLAEDADLPGVYMAWLSQGETSPKNRFGIDDDFLGRYERPDAVVIAESWADLTGGELLNQLSISESGEDLGGSVVWTNTTESGSSKGGFDCKGWSSEEASEKGAYGLSEYKDARWTDSNEVITCTGSARIYCIQVE